jgi:signal transduction histidine kinase
VGRLIVATRSAGSRFTGRERKLLKDVAQHAAVAAEATRLTRDLQASRERLVMAREEERRRLRRDLHDGLGPSLAGMSMQTRAARKLLPAQGRAGEILDAIAGDLRSCTAEVRQLVDQLRPPALDGGLQSALRAECERFAAEAIAIELVVGGSLADLPAAVEVAAYRIVCEALTNVVRHSGARRCTVTVNRCRALEISIVDDGIGMPSEPSAGVGVASMRERAVELGGGCTITAAAAHGTAVRAWLPVSGTTEALEN